METLLNDKQRIRRRPRTSIAIQSSGDCPKVFSPATSISQLALCKPDCDIATLSSEPTPQRLRELEKGWRARRRTILADVVPRERAPGVGQSATTSHNHVVKRRNGMEVVESGSHTAKLQVRATFDVGITSSLFFISSSHVKY